MNVSRKTKLLGFFAAVVAVSVATNLATNYISSKSNNDYAFQNNKIPASYANFASAASAMETDFTVAAELSIHAVVHVKTKTPIKQRFGGFGGLSDPFLEFFFGGRYS